MIPKSSTVLVVLVLNIFDGVIVMHVTNSSSEKHLEACLFQHGLNRAKILPVDGVSFGHGWKGAY